MCTSSSNGRVSVSRIEEVLKEGHVFVTTTGNKDVITKEHMYEMRDQAIVCNIGHFDNEIQVNAINEDPNVKRQEIKPQLDCYTFPEGESNFHISRGTLSKSWLFHWTSKFCNVKFIYQSSPCSNSTFKRITRGWSLCIAERIRRGSC